MPENATHMLMEDLTATVCQSFVSTVTAAPTQEQIQKCFCSPHPVDDMRNHSKCRPVSERGRAPIELLPVEIFGESHRRYLATKAASDS